MLRPKSRTKLQVFTCNCPVIILVLIFVIYSDKVGRQILFYYRVCQQVSEWFELMTWTELVSLFSVCTSTTVQMVVGGSL